MSDVDALLHVLNGGKAPGFTAAGLAADVTAAIAPFRRSSKYL